MNTSLILILPILASSFQGHLLLGEFSLHQDRVRLSAYFDDDLPAGNAKVQVFDSADQKIAEGTTDSEKGIFEFPPLAAGKYRVILDAGQGHRTTLDLQLSGTEGQLYLGAAPTRRAQAGYPWLKVGLGLGLVGLVFMAFLISKWNRAAPEPPAQSTH